MAKKESTYTLWTKRPHDGGPWHKRAICDSAEDCDKVLQSHKTELIAKSPAIQDLIAKYPKFDDDNKGIVESTILESSKHPERFDFKVGDGASTSHVSDSHPCEVVKVTPSGLTITVVSVDWKYTGPKTQHGIWIDHGWLGTELATFSRFPDNDYSGNHGTVYRWSNKKEGFYGHGGRLSAGYCVHRNPHN